MTSENTSWTWRNYKAYFISGFFGKGEYLSRTENIVHALGSLTSLCCTDKKGILSWPNTSAEKVFLLKKDDLQSNQKVSVEPSKGHDFNLPSKMDINILNSEEATFNKSGDDKDQKNQKLNE